MEGVMDAPMRALLTERGGLSFCVSEFLRVSQELLPPKVFYRHVPEISNSWRTPSQVPVQLQLLGSDEEKMGLHAERAVQLGAQAIDINFGCPAPTVNRHEGGASLLRYPDRIRSVVRAVRQAVPLHIPVSAKLRLGWEVRSDIFHNAEQAVLGGASWLTIHARTKKQGYAPPVDWKTIGVLKKQLDIPIVANGDIWSLDDFKRCRDETTCEHFMIGRGALAFPQLAQEIGRELRLQTSHSPTQFGQDPQKWLPLLRRFAEISEPLSTDSDYTLCRIKQWIKYAGIKNRLPWFDLIKRAQTLNEVFSTLQSTHFIPAESA
jgi:tRNA-dihydrouridine synthase C